MHNQTLSSLCCCKSSSSFCHLRIIFEQLWFLINGTQHPTTTAPDFSSLVSRKYQNMPVRLTWMDWLSPWNINASNSCWLSAERLEQGKSVSETFPSMKKGQTTDFGMFVVTEGWARVRHRDDSVNWGHTCGASFPFNLIFWRMICPQDQRRKWHKFAQFSSETWQWNKKPFIISSNYMSFEKQYAAFSPLPVIIISTNCQNANTISLICCTLQSITPFTPRSEEKTVALTVVSQHLSLEKQLFNSMIIMVATLCYTQNTPYVQVWRLSHCSLSPSKFIWG